MIKADSEIIKPEIPRLLDASVLENKKAKMTTDNPPMTTQALPLDVPLQPAIFEGVPGQPHQGSFPDIVQFNQQSQSHFWPGRSCGGDSFVPIYTANEEELRSESGETSISNVYSQGCFSKLWQRLGK